MSARGREAEVRKEGEGRKAGDGQRFMKKPRSGSKSPVGALGWAGEGRWPRGK